MLKKEYQILKPFAEKPWKKFTFKEIKECSKKKSESYVYNSLKKFVKENALFEEKIGNSVVYSLNFAVPKALIYAGFIAEYAAWQKKHIPYDDLKDFMLKIPTHFFVFIITGSYANNTQKKDSDMDIIVICDDSYKPKRIYAELKQESAMNIPPIHLYVFKKSEFLGMLLDKKANYGKEAARNNLILWGGQEYYKIISEAIKNGFNG